MRSSSKIHDVVSFIHNVFRYVAKIMKMYG